MCARATNWGNSLSSKVHSYCEAKVMVVGKGEFLVKHHTVVGPLVLSKLRKQDKFLHTGDHFTSCIAMCG